MAVTKLSLQCDAFLRIIVIIFGIISLLNIMKLMYHFKDVKGRILLTFGLIIMIINIVSNVWLGILGNNSIFTFINDIYPFIDNHCLSSSKIIIMMHPIYMSALQTFILMRMYYLFKTFPAKYRLSSVTYRITNSIAAISWFLIDLTILQGTRDSFKIKMSIAMDNNKYKQCIISIFDLPKIWGINLFGPLCMFLFLLSMYTQYICITKLYQFNKYSNNGYIYNDFNNPSLQQKTKKIKNMLYLPIISILCALCALLIDKLFEYRLYASSNIIDIITTLYFVNTYFNDNNNNNNINNLSVHLFQDSNRLNQPSFDIDIMRFNVDKMFIKNAQNMFKILSEIIYVTSIAQLIAEYASTLYLKCIECDVLLGYIETYKDWGRHNGALVNKDKYDNIRYYMNIKTASWSQVIGEREYEYDQDIKVLCVQCAIKYTSRLHKYRTGVYVTEFFEV